MVYGLLQQLGKPKHYLPELDTLDDIYSCAIWILNMSCGTEYGSPIKSSWINPVDDTVLLSRIYYATRILLQNNEIGILGENSGYNHRLNFSHALLHIKTISQAYKYIFVQLVCHIPGIVCLEDPFGKYLLVTKVTLNNFQKKYYVDESIFMSKTTQRIYSNPSLEHTRFYGTYEKTDVRPEIKYYRWETVLRPVLLVFKRKIGVQDGGLFRNVISFL